MEGSANSRNVSNYEMLAQYYDELLQDEEALSLWLKYIEEERFKTVLELASGSGVMAGILKNKGYDVTATATLDQFTDADEVGNWAVDGMVWAKEFHIVNGIAADLLAPKATATRIQFVAMLHRYCTNIIVGLS